MNVFVIKQQYFHDFVYPWSIILENMPHNNENLCKLADSCGSVMCEPLKRVWVYICAANNYKLV